MMKKLQSLKTDIDTSIQFVAAEYKYAKDLQVQLEHIQNEEADKGLQDARKGFKILRWIARAERKAYRLEESIGKILNSLSSELPEKLGSNAEELLKKFKIAERKILLASSSFTGDLQQQFKDIKTDEELLQKLKGKNTEKLRSHLGALCTKTSAAILELIQWVAAMEEILREIKGFEQQLEKVM